MTQRSFDDAFWGDKFVQSLPPNAKLLFAYLWTNKSCNQAALYEITIRTITFETGFEEKELPPLFETLKPKVQWYPDNNIVWVKNFVKRQPKSPQFLIGVAKCLKDFSSNNNGLVKEFLEYNKSFGISIPYEYATHTVSIPYPYRKDTLINYDETKDKKHTVSHTVSIPTDKIRPELDKKEGGMGETDLDNVYKVYEDNIGILTPFISEQLKDIDSHFPKGWFGEAVKEACKYNARNLNYVQKILNTWEVKGFKYDKPIKQEGQYDQRKKYKRTNP